MEKAGAIFGNKNLEQKGAEKRGMGGDNY